MNQLLKQLTLTMSSATSHMIAHPVTETHELPSQAATEVDPPATPVETPELRRSQRTRQVPGRLKDYVLT